MVGALAGSESARLLQRALAHAAYRPYPARELARRGAVGDDGLLLPRRQAAPPLDQPDGPLVGVVLDARVHVGVGAAPALGQAEA